MSEIVSFPKLGINLSVPQVAFSIGSFDIYWYAVIIAIGASLALLYGLRKCKNYGVNSEKLVDVVIVGLFGAIIFARLYYVIFSWDSFRNNIMDTFNIRDGGIAIYGAIIGAILFGCIMAKIIKVKILPLLDIAGLGFLIGQCIGRWGNFFNVEAFGVNTSLPWGMTSSKIQSYLEANMFSLNNIGVSIDPSAPVHPTFLYESLWCLLGFIILHIYSKYRKFDGEIFLMYIAWYSLGRTFIEGLRTDSLMVGSLRSSQVLSIILFISSFLMLIFIRININKKGLKEKSYLYCNTDESKEVISGEYYKKLKESKIKYNEEDKGIDVHSKGNNSNKKED